MQGAESPRIVYLQGSLTIDRAAALKGELLEALDAPGNVSLNLSQVEDIDLACLQVLYAAKAWARSRELELHIIGSTPPRVSSKLFRCGFLRGSPDGAEGLEAGLVNF